jgi:hypothetical protein
VNPLLILAAIAVLVGLSGLAFFVVVSFAYLRRRARYEIRSLKYWLRFHPGPGDRTYRIK